MIDLLSTATSGLLAFQRALATTGHNIANANTPGFSRQRAELATRPPQDLGVFVGTGVQVSGIGRVFDAFLTQQVRSHSASFSRLETLQGQIAQVSSLVGDANAGLSPALEDFFAAVQDVADGPAATPARTVLLGRAEALAARLRDLDRQLADAGEGVNRQIQDTVGEINQLAQGIAAANGAIALAGGRPNDLLDHRDQLLADLSRRVAVQAVTDSDGNVNVFIGNGQSLVVGQTAGALVAERSAFDPQELAIRLEGQTPGADLAAQLGGGRLGGLLAARDEVLNPTRNALGLLAIGLADTVNAQHRQGIDLDGNLGGDFFQAGGPQAFAHDANAGSAAVTVAIADAGQLTGADYELTATAGGFLLRRLDNGVETAFSGAGPFAVDGLTLTVAGAPAAGDRFLLQPVRAGAFGFQTAVADTDAIAAAAPVRTAQRIGNLGDGQISPGEVVDSTDPDLRRAVDIVFTAADAFDVVDVASGTVLAAGQPYVSGAPFVVNGVQVTISGDPEPGDVFELRDNAGGAGDNRNALALAGLASRPLLLGGSADYQDVYARLVAEVGARGSRTEDALAAQEALLEQAVQSRDAVSGVNLDEEAANLLRFQQAYEAAAQLIRVSDTLFASLLDAVRR